MPRRFVAIALLSMLTTGSAALAAAAEVVITEIMYNPASTEGGSKPGPDGEPTVTRAEWVEIYNAGDDEVDLSGWVLRDRSGATEPLGEGHVLPAGGVAVLVPEAVTPEQFAEAWGEGITVWPIGPWENGGLRNLANNPKQGEAVELLDAEGESVDVVNYHSGGDWPATLRPDGGSIAVSADALSAEANDDPAAWSRSEAGVAGAWAVTQTDAFDGEDVGSPGKLPPDDAATGGDSPDADEPE